MCRLFAALLLPLLLCRAQATEEGAKLLVMGSVNLDTTAHLLSLPVRGETAVARHSPTLALGGKGANQAVALRRLASAHLAVGFVCRLGDDAAGSWLRQQLSAAGLADSGCAAVPDTASGQGLVWLDGEGAATSVVIGGANALGWPSDEAALRAQATQAVRGASLLLLQREVPERVNVAFAAAASAANATVLLDAGGEASFPSHALLASVDFLAPNESELERLAGAPAATDAAALAAATRVLDLWPTRVARERCVLATLGARGALLLARPAAAADGAGDRAVWQPPAPLPGGEPVDATAAGDAFRAAFGAVLAEGGSEAQALRLGAAAGAIAASRLGAAPSLPSRAEAEALETPPPRAREAAACAAPAEARAELRFASRLNSMRARRDLAPPGEADDVLGWIARLGRADGITHLFLNHPQHTETGFGPGALRDAARAAGLRPAAVCTRFPSDRFRAGALSAADALTRDAAVALVAGACAAAAALGAAEVVVWPQFDGYDYHMAANYSDALAAMAAGLRAARAACPSSVGLSLEWKPTDAAARFSFVPNTASALLLARRAGPGVGVTLDMGHSLAAGENPAQSAALLLEAGLLAGVQLGDAHSRLGAEDGLVVGSVHAAAALELAHTLRVGGWDGVLYFDTFPAELDPVEEAALNVRVVRGLWRRSLALEAAGIGAALERRDALASLKLQMETLAQ